MASSVTVDQSTLPPELWMQICLHLPSIADLARTSAVCRFLRAVIHDDCFLRRYQLKHRLHRNAHLQIWLQFTNRKDLFYNAISAERTIAGNRERDCAEVSGVFFSGDQFFDGQPCLTHVRSKISLSYNFNDHNLEQWTISFWISISSEETSSPCCRIRFRWSHRSDSTIALNCKDNTIQWYDDSQQYSTDAHDAMRLDEWIHVAVVVDCRSVRPVQMYINGEQLDAFDPEIDGSRLVSLSELAISNASHFGNLADLGVWSMRLSPMELRAIAEQKTTIDCVDVCRSFLG